MTCTSRLELFAGLLHVVIVLSSHGLLAVGQGTLYPVADAVLH